MWPVGFEPVEFKEARDWFLQRVPMTREEVDKLDATAKRRAFFVSQVAELDIITQAWRATDGAIEKGQTLEDFKKEIGPKLEAAWAGSVANPAARLETIYRTNVQHAYAAGRYEQMNAPAVRKRRPYREFNAIMDGRTSPICAPLDGTVLAVDDEFWQTHLPPLHFQCRSTVLALTEEQAKAKGIAPRPPDGPAPLEGFGGTPDQEWTPDVSDRPDELRAVFERKVAASEYADDYEANTGSDD